MKYLCRNEIGEKVQGQEEMKVEKSVERMMVEMTQVGVGDCYEGGNVGTEGQDLDGCLRREGWQGLGRGKEI